MRGSASWKRGAHHQGKLPEKPTALGSTGEARQADPGPAQHSSRAARALPGPPWEGGGPHPPTTHTLFGLQAQWQHKAGLWFYRLPGSVVFFGCEGEERVIYYYY